MNIIDLHCDTISRLYAGPGEGVSLRHAPQFQIDLEKMRKGNYLVQNFALFLDLAHTEHPAQTALSMADLYYSELDKNKDLILPAFRCSDIVANQAAGKMSAMLTLEEGGILEGNLDNLQLFYDKGVRMITLTWNYPNTIGHPNMIMGENGIPLFHRRCESGLSPVGIELVRDMMRLGIIVDVSHASDGVFYDVLKYTDKPFAASHSNAAAICNVCRNLTDDMIRALADRGGVMGLNFCTAFLTESALPDSPADAANTLTDPRPAPPYVSTVEDMVRHVRHIADTGGVEVLGLGSDFDGISNAVEFTDASGIQILADALKKAGFCESDLDKIFYKNVLRLYNDAL